MNRSVHSKVEDRISLVNSRLDSLDKKIDEKVSNVDSKVDKILKLLEGGESGNF